MYSEALAAGGVWVIPGTCANAWGRNFSSYPPMPSATVLSLGEESHFGTFVSGLYVFSGICAGRGLGIGLAGF